MRSPKLKIQYPDDYFLGVDQSHWTGEHYLWAAVFLGALKDMSSKASSQQHERREARRWLFNNDDPEGRRPGTCKWICRQLGIEGKLENIRRVARENPNRFVGASSIGPD